MGLVRSLYFSNTHGSFDIVDIDFKFIHFFFILVSGKQCVHRNKKKRNSKDVESKNKTNVFVTLLSRLEKKCN